MNDLTDRSGVSVTSLKKTNMKAIFIPFCTMHACRTVFAAFGGLNASVTTYLA